mgnify:FL=1|tara:strand:- start:907 stop:1110 length:204 start_codon:yes stop_codon:yes gene_type:complete
MEDFNYKNWIEGTYQGYDNPTENTEEPNLCKDCQNEFEEWDNNIICYYCEVCDDCKEYKENCECINE